MLVDFEKELPCSQAGDRLGFRKEDAEKSIRVEDGAAGSRWSMQTKLTPGKNDLFFQGKVRRMYLATKSPRYISVGPNALSFWLKAPKGSSLLAYMDVDATLGVWTYHWKPGDPAVGGTKNRSLLTDSMMHGYADLKIDKAAADRWINIILSPSAFAISREYYHFYAAEGTTDDLKFFPSLRQLQFRIFAEIGAPETFQIDELELLYLMPTAVFEEDFFRDKVPADVGEVRVPVTISNPTRQDRKYRVFISSCLGVSREEMHDAFALADNIGIMQEMQKLAYGDGGLGVAELVDERGVSVIQRQEEIAVPARSIWKGEMVYHIRPEMLGDMVEMEDLGMKFSFRRDTLTTSVIVWDPYDKTSRGTKYVKRATSNADALEHVPPPGFPPQERPPEGWRTSDIPLSQVGGYFVSVITLTDPEGEAAVPGETISVSEEGASGDYTGL